MAQQTFIVRLHEDLGRQLVDFLAEGGHGYASLNEFLAVAILNQLAAERSTEEGMPLPEKGMPTSDPLLRVPEDVSLELAEAQPVDDRPLFVLTNRLSPIKIACRVVANLAASAGAWPEIEVFQSEAAAAARRLGVRLRQEDESSRRASTDRRWVAYPVGRNVRAAMERYAFSFTLSPEANGAAGPMAILQLAGRAGDRVVLTSHGRQLARAPSALLAEAPGSTLSDAETRILRECLMRAPGELASIREFLGLVKRAAGSQARVDELLGAAHAGWTADYAAAHRASMIGRLREVGAIRVEGRGLSASIDLDESAQEFVGVGARGAGA